MDLQRGLQSVTSCLPGWFRNYTALHLDSIPKIINHLLLLIGFCNVILFLSCWHTPVVSDVGFPTPLCVLILMCQNLCLFIIFNNASFEGLQILAPTEFMVGNSLGITIGAAILAFVVATFHRKVANCTTIRSAVHEFLCTTLEGGGGAAAAAAATETRGQSSLSSLAFWFGLVFWLEFCLSLLIAVGRSEIVTMNQQYENLSVDDRFPEFAVQPQQQQPQQQSSSTVSDGVMGNFANNLPTPSFFGNYSTVPEVNDSPPTRSVKTALRGNTCQAFRRALPPSSTTTTSLNLRKVRKAQQSSSTIAKPFQLSKHMLATIVIVIVTTVSSVNAAHNNLPFALGVRDSFMIAHSFHNNPKFGPAGGLHGATYTCDVEFLSKDLVEDAHWVIDIGVATTLLKQVLAKYNYKNLDDVFPDKTLTTTEFMARQIHQDLCELLRSECKEFQGNLCVKLWESHAAWASFTGKVQ